MGQGYTEREVRPKVPLLPPGPPIWTAVEQWDESAIPPRSWLAQGYFLRGAVTTVVGAGGVSKSSLVIAWSVALALGQECHGMKPRARYRSVLFNVEDDEHEQQRRLSATLTNRGKMPADVAGYIARSGPTRTGLLFDRDPETGDVQPTPALLMLEHDLLAGGVDVLFVDPLAELHSVEENDNTGMRAIVAEFRALAIRLNIAVVIVHHMRKGINAPGDADAGRGASAISGASRVVLTVTPMTPEDCKAFGMPETQARHFFRVDGGKSNYASLTSAEWFERVVYELANGDSVAVPQPWEPPQDAITPEVQVKVEAAVRRGSADGSPLSPQLGNTARSVKHALVDAGIVTQPGQKEMLLALYKAGFQQLRFKDSRRKFVGGIRSPDGLPSADWEDDQGVADVEDDAA